MSGRDRASRVRSRLCRETSRVPARARQSQNVPVSYPREVQISSRRQHDMPICRAFLKPSDGLEPSTPSLPWRFRGGTSGHGPSLAMTFFLQISRLSRVSRARACPRVLGPMYPSRTRGSLPVCKTSNRRAWTQVHTLLSRTGRRPHSTHRVPWVVGRTGCGAEHASPIQRQGVRVLGGLRRGWLVVGCSRLQVSVGERHRHRSVTDGACDALGRAIPDVAGREDAGPAGFER